MVDLAWRCAEGIPQVRCDREQTLEGRASATEMTEASSSENLLRLQSEILEAVAGVLDVGVLPGTPSTVVDVTGSEPCVLREGAVPAATALAQFRE